METQNTSTLQQEYYKGTLQLRTSAGSIGLYVNAHKTEYMCYNQTGNISTLDGTPLKLVDKFTYLGSNVASTEKDIDTRLTKAWTAINRLSIIWRSDLTDKMKRSFFQAAVTSILLYGGTTWTQNGWRRSQTVIAASNLEQVLAAPPHKTPTVRPPASYHENYSSQTNQTCRTLLEKQGRTHKRCTLMDTHTWPCKSKTTSTNIHSAAI